MSNDTATAATFSIARNAKTSFYEIHKAGCSHTRLSHMEVMVEEEVSRLDGDALAKEAARMNEGCAYTTGPCVKRGKREVHWG